MMKVSFFVSGVAFVLFMTEEEYESWFEANPQASVWKVDYIE